MKNWKRFPKNIDVAQYVECYWFLEKEPGDIGCNFPKLNPDPSSVLIIARPNCQYHYQQATSLQKGSGDHWIFPHRKMFTMDHSKPFQIPPSLSTHSADYNTDQNA